MKGSKGLRAGLGFEGWSSGVPTLDGEVAVQEDALIQFPSIPHSPVGPAPTLGYNIDTVHPEVLAPKVSRTFGYQVLQFKDAR